MAEKLAQTVEAILFLSVDIVDSASYKSNNVNAWGRDFQKFFNDFPEMLNCACQKPGVAPDRVSELPCPSIWKIAGDEMLFYVKIGKVWESLPSKDQIQPYELVLFYTVPFIKAIESYNSRSHKILIDNGKAFKVKGCAWFADVVAGSDYDSSYGNLEIKVDSLKGSQLSPVDFIGRQIDIGFRIQKFSTLDRLVLSVEYCILLIRDNYLTLEDQGIFLHYDGRRNLKGPVEQIGYPIVYIDMNDKFAHSEAALMGANNEAANPVVLLRLMQEYLYKTNSILYFPFVHEADRHFGNKPFSLEEENGRI